MVFGDNPPARLLSVDLVIDHHPERPGYDAVIRDIRVSYGATATIITEYLQAADIDIRPKLGTALLYGIKSDTQLLGRDTSSADIQAFLAAGATPYARWGDWPLLAWGLLPLACGRGRRGDHADRAH